MTEKIADKKLESFKVGDTHRAGMSKPPQNPRAKKGQEQNSSVGFGRIEAILEKEDPVEVSKSLDAILQGLATLEEGSPSNKEKLAVRKARVAVERAADLMDYLFQTKAALEAEMQQKP